MSPTPPETSPTGRRRGLDLLLAVACVCVIVGSLKAASAFFMPVTLALLLSLVCIPAVRRLERWRVPHAVAVLVVLTVVALMVLVVPVVIGASVTQFQSALPGYRERLAPLLDDLAGVLREFGWEGDPRLSRSYDTGALLQFVADTTRGLVTVLSNAVVVLLVTIFTLFEARALRGKLAGAFGGAEAAHALEQIALRIGRYVSTKAAMSLLTGAAVGLWITLFGVDFPLLWGFVAFAFNFIPNIGSIVAAIPAILLAWIEFGFGTSLLVTGGYLAINFSISNALEPHLMGTRLGLSTLVVFLSLVFWFWVWGPVGMLLSVPLTMALKIVLEHSDDFRPIAVLLGRGDQPARE